jgi:hypothetical protein
MQRAAGLTHVCCVTTRAGTALFIAAGSSLSITSTNTAAALDAW